MQNQKNYQNFTDQQSYSTGIPVGQPIRYEDAQYQAPIRQNNQAPYFQQPIGNPYLNRGQQANLNQMPPNFNQLPQNFHQVPNMVQGPVLLQPHNTKMYNSSLPMKCQCCKQNVQTIVNNQSGNTAYIWGAAICCVVGQCCCLPFMFDDCLDKTHYCPICGQTILRKHAKCFDIIN